MVGIGFRLVSDLNLNGLFWVYFLFEARFKVVVYMYKFKTKVCASNILSCFDILFHSRIIHYSTAASSCYRVFRFISSVACGRVSS